MHALKAQILNEDADGHIEGSESSLTPYTARVGMICMDTTSQTNVRLTSPAEGDAWRWHCDIQFGDGEWWCDDDTVHLGDLELLSQGELMGTGINV